MKKGEFGNNLDNLIKVNYNMDRGRRIQSPRISIISENGKKYLYMVDFTNWIIIFQNIKKIEIDECCNILYFEKFILHNVNLLVDTSTLYNYSFERVPIKLEIVANQNEADPDNGKIFLEKNKEYYIYVMPMGGHPGPVYLISFDGQNVHVIN